MLTQKCGAFPVPVWLGKQAIWCWGGRWTCGDVSRELQLCWDLTAGVLHDTSESELRHILTPKVFRSLILSRPSKWERSPMSALGKSSVSKAGKKQELLLKPYLKFHLSWLLLQDGREHHAGFLPCRKSLPSKHKAGEQREAEVLN